MRYFCIPRGEIFSYRKSTGNRHLKYKDHTFYLFNWWRHLLFTIGTYCLFYNKFNMNIRLLTFYAM